MLLHRHTVEYSFFDFHYVMQSGEYAMRYTDSPMMARSAYKLRMLLHNQEQATLAEGYVIVVLHIKKPPGEKKSKNIRLSSQK